MRLPSTLGFMMNSDLSRAFQKSILKYLPRNFGNLMPWAVPALCRKLLSRA